MYIYESEADLIRGIQKYIERETDLCNRQINNSTLKSHARLSAIARRGALLDILGMVKHAHIRPQDTKDSEA